MKPAPLFHDHAVLQRDIPLPVWGTATPGSSVSVTLGDRSAITTTNDDGSWLLRLPPQPAGGPFELIIENTGEPFIVRDVLLGDVWVCSGQSNMEFQLSQTEADNRAPLSADHPRIRILTVATPAKAGRQSVIGSTWKCGSAAEFERFSAVAGWFGHTLHTALDVPIGLIANAWGGTRIQAWISREALMTDPAGCTEVTAYETLLYPPTEPERVQRPYASVDDWFRAVGPENPLNLGADAGWKRAEFDDSAWPEMIMPCRWQDKGFDHSGIFWFRRRVSLPPAWKGKDLALHLGAVDKHDDSYVNGIHVGSISWENRNSWCAPRDYRIPASLTLDAEDLCISIRARSHVFHGGMIGPATAMKIHPVDNPADSRPLTGAWRYHIEQNWGITNPPASLDLSRGPGGQNAPYTLFNSRLAPLIPYGIRGWIWYQGESNANESALYRRLQTLMIEDWRRTWGLGNLPFLLVQLANFGAAQDNPPESSDWARLRAAQSAALRLPGVGMAVAVDVGDADDIHPKNKKAVGQRLARWALANVYGHGGLPSGPLLSGMNSNGNGSLRLSFHHSTGLRTRDAGPVLQLAIAGPDRKFVWAQSRIDGEHLEVWHSDIPHPAAVRYAWADNPHGCNLVNADDFPASPFDTDDLGYAYFCMEKRLILIPTYNEKTNIAMLVEAIARQLPDADCLFIDDNSPDGTGAEIDRIARENPHIHVLHRPDKAGLGRAYLAGFRWSLDRGYSYSVCMDADLSHAAEDLPRFFEALADSDLVAGSRYIPGGRIINWPRERLWLSRTAALYTRLLSGLPFSDPTGGFNAYRNRLLAALPLDRIDSNGYSFQIEMKHLAWMEGFAWREIPITFTERREGKSKMSPGIVREALWVVWKLVLRRGLRRRPLRKVHADSIRAGVAP